MFLSQDPGTTRSPRSSNPLTPGDLTLLTLLVLLFHFFDNPPFFGEFIGYVRYTTETGCKNEIHERFFFGTHEQF